MVPQALKRLLNRICTAGETTEGQLLYKAMPSCFPKSNIHMFYEPAILLLEKPYTRKCESNSVQSSTVYNTKKQ